MRPDLQRLFCTVSLITLPLTSWAAPQRSEIIVVGGAGGVGNGNKRNIGPTYLKRKAGGVVMNPRPWNEQADYVTPTPLPDRPDWEIKDWVEYFEEKHPNFWFLEQLKKNQTEAAKENEESDASAARTVENATESDKKVVDDEVEEEHHYSVTALTPETEVVTETPSTFSPTTPDWINWSPQQWVNWSKSEEYKAKYQHPLRSNRPPYNLSQGVYDYTRPPFLAEPTKIPGTTPSPHYVWRDNINQRRGSKPTQRTFGFFQLPPLITTRRPVRPYYSQWQQPIVIRPLSSGAGPVDKAALLVKKFQEGKDATSTPSPLPPPRSVPFSNIILYPYTTTRRPAAGQNNPSPHMLQSQELSSFNIREQLEHASEPPLAAKTSSVASSRPGTMGHWSKVVPHAPAELFDFVMNTFGTVDGMNITFIKKDSDIERYSEQVPGSQGDKQSGSQVENLAAPASHVLPGNKSMTHDLVSALAGHIAKILHSQDEQKSQDGQVPGKVLHLEEAAPLVSQPINEQTQGNMSSYVSPEKSIADADYGILKGGELDAYLTSEALRDKVIADISKTNTEEDDESNERLGNETTEVSITKSNHTNDHALTHTFPGDDVNSPLTNAATNTESYSGLVENNTSVHDLTGDSAVFEQETPAMTDSGTELDVRPEEFHINTSHSFSNQETTAMIAANEMQFDGNVNHEGSHKQIEYNDDLLVGDNDGGLHMTTAWQDSVIELLLVQLQNLIEEQREEFSTGIVLPESSLKDNAATHSLASQGVPIPQHNFRGASAPNPNVKFNDDSSADRGTIVDKPHNVSSSESLSQAALNKESLESVLTLQQTNVPSLLNDDINIANDFSASGTIENIPHIVPSSESVGQVALTEESLQSALIPHQDNVPSPLNDNFNKASGTVEDIPHSAMSSESLDQEMFTEDFLQPLQIPQKSNVPSPLNQDVRYNFAGDNRPHNVPPAESLNQDVFKAESVNSDLDVEVDLDNALLRFSTNRIHYNLPQDENSLGPAVPLRRIASSLRNDQDILPRPLPYDISSILDSNAGFLNNPQADGSLIPISSLGRPSNRGGVEPLMVSGFAYNRPSSSESLGDRRPPLSFPTESESSSSEGGLSRLLTDLEALIRVLKITLDQGSALWGAFSGVSEEATTTTTTPAPVTTTTPIPDAATSVVNMVADMPFQTRRRMMAYMMFGVPMVALTMATVGVPVLYIAPLSMVIPGTDIGEGGDRIL